MKSVTEKILVLELSEVEALALYDALINGYETDLINDFKAELKTILHVFQDR